MDPSVIKLFKTHPRLGIAIILCVIIALPTGRKIGNYCSDQRILADRQKLEQELGSYLNQNMPGESDLINSTKSKTRFSEEGWGDCRTDFLGNKKYDCYDWHDDFTVALYVDDTFDSLSTEKQMEQLHDFCESAHAEYEAALTEIAPKYAKAIGIPLAYHACEVYYQSSNVRIFVYTSSNKYYFDEDDWTIYYKNGSRINKDWHIRRSSSESKSTSASSSTRKSSGSRKTYNSLNYDPADYDDPDDYAEDAWGSDYDDYDDAYDAWEDY